MIIHNRRAFITGLVSLLAAPAIVRASSLMPVKVMLPHYHIGDIITFKDYMNKYGTLQKFVVTADNRCKRFVDVWPLCDNGYFVESKLTKLAESCFI
jgi:hypothetical protein